MTRLVVRTPTSTFCLRSMNGFEILPWADSEIEIKVRNHKEPYRSTIFIPNTQLRVETDNL